MKIKLFMLIGLVTLLCFVVVFFTRSNGGVILEEEQIKARDNMIKAEEYIKNKVIEKGINEEEEDLNHTYLLGPEFSEIVTTNGDLGAKRTSLNPLFASSMIRYFYKAGLSSGDTIAVGTSGSFPGLLIAVLVSAKEYGLNVKIIPSLGSSMHGASRTEFNIFDFLDSLEEGGFASFSVVGVSMGGQGDRGGGVLDGFIYENTKEYFRDISSKYAEKRGCDFISYENLEDSIQHHLRLFGDNISLYINIGGAAANSGESSYTLSFPQGLVLDPPRIPSVEERGLNFEFAAKGVPVLNLLNIKKLSSENGIPFDSIYINNKSNDGIMGVVTYNKASIWISLGVIGGVIIFSIFYLKKKKIL